MAYILVHMSDNSITRQASTALSAATSGAATLTTTVAVLWAVHGANIVLQGALHAYGIMPRNPDALYGIAFAPFLHGSIEHLLLNTVSLVILGALTMVRRRSDFVAVSVISGLVSGLGTWLIGAPGTVHIGASGVIFGYLGFLMARGFFERSLSAILLSAGVIWFFHAMVWGVLPTVAAGISWEAHLFGFLGGISSAWLLTPRRARAGRPQRG